jgi:low density lipoprotein-related protein 2
MKWFGGNPSYLNYLSILVFCCWTILLVIADSRLTLGSGDPSGVICPLGMFRCPEGKCIPAIWVCNYEKDCEKGEDEFQSCSPPDCEPGQLTCRQYIWNKTYCIPPHYRCDMTVDCIDGSDETECTYRKCQADDFHCGPKTSDPCIPKEKKCDGYLDCRSGKDEQGCSGAACRLDQFRCANGQRCVEHSQKCDHKNDCGDNSDEQGCSTYIYLLLIISLFK